MRKSLFAPILIAPIALAACAPSPSKPLYQIPVTSSPCDGLDLSSGQISGIPEFEQLFACLNDEHSLDQIAPTINDLATTTNPNTGMPYLQDLINVTNAALASPDLAGVLQAAANVVHSGEVEQVLPVGSALIDSGLVHQLLPLMQQSIDSGAVASSLPATSALLRDPRMPQMEQAIKQVIDDGISQGWMTNMLPDLATLLTVKDGQGNPALRTVLPAMLSAMQGQQASGIIPVVNTLIDTGTMNQLAQTTRSLYDQNVLQAMPGELEPMMRQDASGHSNLQGTLDILAATNGPLVCIGITVSDNLAQTILSTMADQTPSTVQNLTSILDATLGLGGLVCDIPQPVQDNMSSLDALAKSGALNGLLPMLKVFKQQNQIPLLVGLLVQVHDSNALPVLEPVLIDAIDAGVAARAIAVVPHLIGADGTPTPEMSSILAGLDLLVSPGADGVAPATKLLPLMGAAGATDAQAMADALYLLGTTMQDPNNHFDAVLPAISAAFGADPNNHLGLMIADLIDQGTLGSALPMTSHLIQTGDVDALLPWMSKMIQDGTADALFQLLSRTFDVMEVVPPGN